MKGHGKTVFSGTTPESFDIEVISTLRNFRPNQDLILIKTPNHPRLDAARTVAGMSGSPIYLNNKMIGAYAYGWLFGSRRSRASRRSRGCSRRWPPAPEGRGAKGACTAARGERHAGPSRADRGRARSAALPADTASPPTPSRSPCARRPRSMRPAGTPRARLDPDPARRHGRRLDEDGERHARADGARSGQAGGGVPSPRRRPDEVRRRRRHRRRAHPRRHVGDGARNSDPGEGDKLVAFGHP